MSETTREDRPRAVAGVEFPYFGEPYTHDEQHGVSPAPHPTGGVHAQYMAAGGSRPHARSRTEASVVSPAFHWLVIRVTAPGASKPCHSQASGFAAAARPAGPHKSGSIE